MHHQATLPTCDHQYIPSNSQSQLSSCCSTWRPCINSLY